MMWDNVPYQYILVDDKPVPEPNLDAWVKWFADAHRRVVKRTYLARDGALVPPNEDILNPPRSSYACVSTVFLATDHNYAWGRGATPVLYETMIFLKKDRFLDPQWRYATREQAIHLHDRIVEQAQQWLREGSTLADKPSEDWVEV
jgi:hypothetical protein